MNAIKIRWARVEYQPDMQRPTRAPVPLGVIMFYRSPEGGQGVVVLGREPRTEEWPSELKEVGQLGFAQLRGWTGSLAKDAGDASLVATDPFAALASRWRWNVYVTDAESLEIPVKEVESDGDFRTGLLGLGQRFYEGHVKEPFRISSPSVDRRLGGTGRRAEWVRREVDSLAVTS